MPNATQISAAKASSQTGIPKRTILAAITRGDLPAHRPGDGATSAWVIDQADLDAWLAQR